ncbi:hypothetical protein HRR83_002605 [Exophiala dermatitidis]|nr:hypothetical protein HRR73_005547 [Exophiala dermatitidis]KAJ4571298.1 hypothetical protein HRR82_007296 [Exophiala dermatitidis]KAJ4601407.1 hypothetical protein HRR83_002605 [Exophiala dermatitidis]KAJ4604825.1 hypothetical protein HRR84_001908 [Exophiala dermatitidis]KAJ4670341.1 hypothetical protein HRR95_007176 [Exophiala dermatitidis]
MGKIEISTAEDVDNCGREFSKFSCTLRKGDFDLEECEDMLLDAVDYGSALQVLTAIIHARKLITLRRRCSPDLENPRRGGEDNSKPSKKVRMNTTKKRTRNMMEDSSDDGQTGSSSKKARLGGQKVEAAKVFKELDALLKTTVKGPK